MKRVILFLLSTLLLITPILAQNTQNPDLAACEQAQKDANDNINKPLWFCLGGVASFGTLVASFFIEPKPKLSTLIGKSPEYVAYYTDCYIEKGHKIQTKNALLGCMTFVGGFFILGFATEGFGIE